MTATKTGSRGATAVRALAVVALLAFLMWTVNAHIIDWNAVLLSKPGRLTAAVAGCIAAIVTSLAVGKRTGGAASLTPLLAALVIVGAGSYGLGLYGHTLGATKDCKKGYALNLDGICEKAARK